MSMRIEVWFVVPAVILSLALSACALTGEKRSEERLYLKKSAFDSLPGWQDDATGKAVVPLQRSCARLGEKDPEAELGVGGFAGNASAWQTVCQALTEAIPLTDEEARVFFEENFTPYETAGDGGREGLFTGYYEPVLRGSFKKEAPYLIPLYSRPNDLVRVNLGDFRPDLKGETIMGRVDKENLVPYFKRTEIEQGALAGRSREIIWVDNAVDAFFLHIQGSGQVRMKEGGVVRVGYAAENGQPYIAIGRELIKRGALTKENVSMQAIRDWLQQNPAEAGDVMNLNASYIFFRPLKGEDGPLGAEGVPLTPMRSLAVDRKKIPYGVPVWLDAEEPEGGQRLQHLMVAQDTGGAITGAVRGDFFWGADDDAAHKAGLMKSKGRMWILLPRSVQVPAEKLQQPVWAQLFGAL